jgi:hypothetical protein
MNFKELVDLLNEKSTKEEFGYQDLDANTFGQIKCVKHEGGEDEGSHYETVYHFIDHGIYIKLVGYYSSYEGADFSDAEYEEVKPREKTVIVYE